MKRKINDEKVLSTISSIIMIIIGFLCLFPVLNVVAKSMSSDSAVVAGKVVLWPIGFQLKTYVYIFTKLAFPVALKSSLIVTVVGTILAMLVIVLVAYPISRPDFKGRKFITIYILITMIFEAGFVPNYLLMKNLNLLNTYWAMILPFLVIGFYVFLIKSYMEGLPIEIMESAKIDGASHIQMLVCIVIPLSKPVLATVALFQAVQYWNNYTNAMMYINDMKLQPLPNYLYNLLIMLQEPSQLPVDESLNLTGQVVASAAVVATMIPIVIIYPFIQKYYTKGVTLGAVKG